MIRFTRKVLDPFIPGSIEERAAIAVALVVAGILIAINYFLGA